MPRNDKKLDLPNPVSLQQFEELKKAQEEVLWRANFNSEQTISTYDIALKQFSKFLGIKSFDELRTITHAHVIAFKNSLIEKKLKPATVNTKLSALASLFDHLVDQQVVRVNPVKSVKRIKEEYDNVKVKILSLKEVKAILNVPDKSTLRGIRDQAFLYTFFYTGARISEICNLKVEDFYQEQNVYVLEFKLNGGRRNKEGINPILVQVIQNYLRLTDYGSQKDAPIFAPINNNGSANGLRHMTRINMYMLWKKYAKMAGIEGISPHSARATFITEALKNNCQLDQVQHTVGHRSIRTTQKYDKRGKDPRKSASFLVRY